MTGVWSRLVDRCSLRAATVLGLALTAALLVLSGTVSYTGSDPRGTLLTAQAILEHGTFALDAYPDVPADYRVMERAGHRFYAYPPGTPIAVLPAVALARLAGLDMARDEDDDRLQRVVAAVSVGLTLVLASSLGTRWLPWPPATALAGLLVFGTPVISTMGTALWSTNATVVASLAALLLLSRWETSGAGPRRAGAIGALLGLALWCRPTAIVLAGLVALWMFGRTAGRVSTERRLALGGALALSAAVLASLALLVMMSRLNYGTWLPDYYIGARLASSDRFATALVAHLISPSRGLLIFAPALSLALVAAVLAPRRVLGAPLAALALVWLCLHLIIVSRFPYWWGGFGFGSRLLVDVLPGCFVFSCGAAAAVYGSARRWRLLALVALVPLGAAGVWINSVQGLFNPAAATWNVSPSIDSFPGYALDWHLPQFWATRERLAERVRRHERWLRPPLEPDVEYTAQSPGLDLLDWPGVDTIVKPGTRESLDGTPSLRFLVGDEMLRGAARMMLTLRVGAEQPVTGEVWFNGQRQAQLTISSGEPADYVLSIRRAMVRTVQYDVLKSNTLEWRTSSPHARSPLRFSALRVHAARRRAPG